MIWIGKFLELIRTIKYILYYIITHNIMFSIAKEGQKMLIGVGDVECEFVEKRFKPFKEIFPTMEYLTKDQVCYYTI